MLPLSDNAGAPVRPASHAAREGRRRRHVFLNEALDGAWRRGLLPAPVLDPDRLVKAAQAGMGGLTLAPGSWRVRLDVLVAALDSEAALNPLGLTIAWGQIVAALRNRLRLEALWARHPEVAEVPVPAPIIIMGQMRSGSTRMQRLLACDPQFAATRFFESFNPVPAWPWLPVDDRMARTWLGLRAAHLINPDFAHIHPTGTLQPDEEMGWQTLSIHGAAFEAQWRVPSFAALIEAADAGAAYAEFRRILQTAAWLRRDRAVRPWILKLPQFTQDAPAVLATFPDARVVCLDRPAEEVAASSASLVRNQMELQSDIVDPAWIGREWLRKTALRQRRLQTTLAGAPQRRVHVGFAAMNADWRGEIERVYDALGIPLTPHTLARMARFMAATPRRRLARHAYALADFGLNEGEVRRAIGEG